MTPKQQRFVEEYLVDLNATQAAIRAGYSAKTARQIGEQNLSKLDIAEAVAAHMEQRSEKTGIDSAWVLKKAVALFEKAMAEKAYASAKGALELIGKHVNVQAFREQHEHRLAMTSDEAREVIARMANKYVGQGGEGMKQVKPLERYS